MKPSLRRRVWVRAGGRCEYCGMPSTYADAPFQLDHIIAAQHREATSLPNLALACYHCNLHKGPNLTGIDPASGSLTRLYNPRSDLWAEHFTWRGARCIGLTPIGRTTIAVLAINDPAYVLLRRELRAAGLWT